MPGCAPNVIFVGQRLQKSPALADGECAAVADSMHPSSIGESAIVNITAAVRQIVDLWETARPRPSRLDRSCLDRAHSGSHACTRRRQTDGLPATYFGQVTLTSAAFKLTVEEKK